MIIFEGEVLKTRKGTSIKRSKHGVGKDIGGSLYVHKDYIPTVYLSLVELRKIQLLKSYPTFDFNLVRIDYKKDAVAFYDCKEFDTVNEPVAGNMIVVKEDLVSKPKMVKAIFHHKQLWVGDDYKGFNVSAAWKRSKTWIDTDTDDNPLPFNRIGKKETWLDWLSKNNIAESKKSR